MRIPRHMTTEVSLHPGQQTSGARRIRQLTLVFQRGREPTHHWGLSERKVSFGRDPDRCDVVLEDTKASREHAQLIFVRATGGYRLVDLGSRNGTYLNGRRIESADVQPGAVLRIGDSLFIYSEATVPEGLLLPEPQPGRALSRAVAEAAADLAAPTDLPLLIIGPTGAGKEVMAQRIHKGSGRSGPLVAVNCATFAKELIGSELFGHAQGAFSGAQASRSGLFVSANGGTLFLDEIAELPLDQQPALLRALQEKKVRPVGSDKEVPVDVRLVAATHQALGKLQESGAFRSDLYARLAGFEIDLPGMVERKAEILTFFRKFLESDKPLSSEAAEALLLYDWPQNVRELKHASERARLFLQNSERVELGSLPPNVQQYISEAFSVIDRPSAPILPASSSSNEPIPDTPSATGDLREPDPPSKERLMELLTEGGGNVAHISRATGKHRQQVYRWLKKHNLDPADFRAPEDMGDTT